MTRPESLDTHRLAQTGRLGAVAGLFFFGMPAASIAAPKLLPVLNQPVADQETVVNAPLTVDISSAFGMEEIDDEVVRFTSQIISGEIPLVLDFALFSNRTTVTRTNFLNYVSHGDYVDSIIHRSVPGFVIQGGGFSYGESGFEPVPTDPPIVNEFGISNTLGTISMAKKGDDPNSATSQWFVSMRGNSDGLDSTNGGFSVFGRVTKGTFGNAQIFGNPSNFPINDLSSVHPALDEVPLLPPTGVLILFTDVEVVPLPGGQAGEDPVLGYTLMGNTNPSLATVGVSAGGLLTVTPTEVGSGLMAVTVRATDSVGNTVDNRILVSVNDSYSTWAARNTFPGEQSGAMQNPESDTWSNLQEYAFFGDPSNSDPAGDVVYCGTTGESPEPKYLTLTFPVRRYSDGLRYAVESNDGVSGEWSEIWSSEDGYGHPQVVSAIGLDNRVVVTIKDSQSMDAQSKRFLRARVVEP